MASFLTGPIQTDQWVQEASKVFSDSDLEGGPDQAPNLQSTFKDLHNAYRNNIKSWWEVQSLENYIKAEIVPKGLRLRLIPAARSRSATLLLQWEKELTNSSLRLMNILLTEEKNTLEHTSIKLKELIELALKFKGDPEFVRRELILQNNIEKYQGSLKDRKHKQYIRDSIEFKEKRAYQFLQEKDTDISSSEAGSESDNSRRQGYNNRDQSNYRRGRRGDRRWQSPREQNFSEGEMNPPNSYRGKRGKRGGPRSSSSTSPLPSSSSFLEGRGGVPYGLRERKHPNYTR